VSVSTISETEKEIDMEQPTPQLDVSTRTDVLLGQLVREKITGFEGIVCALSYEVDGTVFVGIQPRGLDNGNPREPLDFDIERVEVVDATPAILNTKGDAARLSVRLGAVYRDRVTGLVGTATRRIDFLGGCTRITIRPKVDKDGKLHDGLMIPVEQAELIDQTPAVEAEKRATPTGGPGTLEAKMMARMSR
jgi:hypothetical protein